MTREQVLAMRLMQTLGELLVRAGCRDLEQLKAATLRGAERAVAELDAAPAGCAGGECDRCGLPRWRGDAGWPCACEEDDDGAL
jgi:hypothetical protein